MSRLSQEEIEKIAKEKNLIILNPESYVSLSSDLEFKCLKCKKMFISNMDTVRSPRFMCPECEKQRAVYRNSPPPKEKDVFRIIGFDQATVSFGISVFDNGQLVYFAVERFNGATENRLASIATFIEKICREWRPDLVELEDIQLQHNNAGYITFKTLAELLGVVKMTLSRENVPHDVVLNKVWQSMFMIGGSNRITQKMNVIKKVKELFDIDVSDDIADAVLIGNYAVHKKMTYRKAF